MKFTNLVPADTLLWLGIVGYFQLGSLRSALPALIYLHVIGHRTVAVAFLRSKQSEHLSDVIVAANIAILTLANGCGDLAFGRRTPVVTVFAVTTLPAMNEKERQAYLDESWKLASLPPEAEMELSPAGRRTLEK